ncbi:hypothetical protein DUF2229 [Thermoclostridium stercorarium subsp. stercorarium DSM 8532]|uniref:DUF2229 domain-containing protein n=1 Tax=Thermoclostridium stercorarium (strain ATCC 35414 / DSM 8532 / NCIMB 11754) TaxID=1121335 RepID=L7VTK0_THES1|nr:acyl-CoA dehydratase activase-related protein [Thermoclostridium stercorarium]AGC69666.1 hypothetical protein DUF2229 [Thermoclostridium stercorarium subsp. stercorarium DSM 8532]AGI40618.1 hypothetical protein Clst_2609 [Thermoclostridium stercorarium subsp. stercorarium DSM 8532]
MRIGIPKGLLYCKYHPFFETFFHCLGAEIVTSENTNKKILDLGVGTCVDEACLPVKIYHGHVASIKDMCDLLVIPRIMQVCKNEYICPKFCGLPEMIFHSISGMPEVTYLPLYMHDRKSLYKWCAAYGSIITRNRSKIRHAFEHAVNAQRNFKTGISELKKINVMLAGHPYVINDAFLNMDIVNKLKAKGIGIITEEFAPASVSEAQVMKLIKKPFWTFQRSLFGASAAFHHQRTIHGIIYLSSFGCGIDSIVIDLIRFHIGEFPMLVIKLDEHTGEAGVETRLEAFIDMLERRVDNENNLPAYGQCLYSGENSV